MLGLLLGTAILGLAARLRHELQTDRPPALPPAGRATVSAKVVAAGAPPRLQPAELPQTLASRPATAGQLVFADTSAEAAWSGQHYVARLQPGSDLPATSLEQEALRALVAQVARQSDQRLARVSSLYKMTGAQQALAYPMVARSTPAYRAAVAEGTITEDHSADAADLAPADATAAGDDAFALALNSSLESLEADLVSSLDPAQQAALSEEQLDRYYWWGEVLLRIQEQQDAELEELVAATLGTAAPAAVAAAAVEPAAGPAVVEPAAGAAPAAHQGGNLFDLFNGAP